MGNEIEKAGTLQEVTQGLTRGQRNYLYGRLMGLSKHDAMGIANRKKAAVETLWPFGGEDYERIESYVLANAENKGFRDEAAIEFVSSMKAKVILALDQLLDKALDWDNIPQTDRPYVMAALKLVGNAGRSSGDKSGEGDGGSYDELILKRRREVK